eukprot:9490825-Pyramimonas_sp.AAC.2
MERTGSEGWEWDCEDEKWDGRVWAFHPVSASSARVAAQVCSFQAGALSSRGAHASRTEAFASAAGRGS